MWLMGAAPETLSAEFSEPVVSGERTRTVSAVSVSSDRGDVVADVASARLRWREALARSDAVAAVARDAHSDLIVAHGAYVDACGGPAHVPEEDGGPPPG